MLISKIKRSRINIRQGKGIGLGNTAQRIVIKAAAFVPWIHDAVVHAEHFLLRAAAAMAAVGAGRFDFVSEQQRSHLPFLTLFCDAADRMIFL